MNRFAELLDRLAYEPSRDNKSRLIIDYFRTAADPDRGYALAAMTGELRFAHAKPALVRALIAERVDPVLFAMSYDYVGDLSETVALLWPTATKAPGDNGPPAPGLGAIVETLHATRKIDLPAQLSLWLDALDETGRWALLKLHHRCAAHWRFRAARQERHRRVRRAAAHRGRGSLAWLAPALSRAVCLG